MVARQRKGAPIAQQEQRDTEELFRARLQRFGDMLLSAMDSSVVFKDAQVNTDVVSQDAGEKEKRGVGVGGTHPTKER